MLVDGISRKQLQCAAVQALIAASTVAEDRVYEPRDWPTKPGMFPALLVQAPRERKTALYPGLLEFTTTITLMVVGRGAGTDPDELNELLDELGGQAENALMLTPAFSQWIQRWVNIETQSVITAEGKQHIGEISIAFEIEVYQAFGAAGDPLTGVIGTIAPGDAAGVQPIVFQTTPG